MSSKPGWHQRRPRRRVKSCAAFGGCGRFNYDAQDSSPLDSIDGAAIDATTETGCTPFSTPVLVARVSTSDSEFSPALTADERDSAVDAKPKGSVAGTLSHRDDSASPVIELRLLDAFWLVGRDRTFRRRQERG